MKPLTGLERLLQKLPPKQQTLDLGSVCLWTHLANADRHACRDAIAALLVQVAMETSFHDEHDLKENRDHER